MVYTGWGIVRAYTLRPRGHPAGSQSMAHAPEPRKRRTTARRAPDPLDRAIGRRIEAITRLRGLTQKRVAIEAGLSVSALSKVQSGVQRLTLRTAVRLVRVLRCDLDDLEETLSGPIDRVLVRLLGGGNGDAPHTPGT